MSSLPAVALESTVISHGLPWPNNLTLAREMEQIVRDGGAEPRTVAILGGELCAGLSAAQLEHLATASGVRKVSRRDLPIVVARKLDGATTVATTMWVAHRFGIEVFATGGIGGVHRSALGSEPSRDISADLQELAQTPVVVVCAGAKAILDLPGTLEYLETHGVTVVGWQTERFPAFYSRDSGLPVDVRCDTADEVAAIWRAKQALGLPGGLLVAAPVPVEAEIA
ncbi:MAG: pseudouridine-5'-phosphate glycosidase, partial [Caldilineaceae bacterium]